VSAERAAPAANGASRLSVAVVGGTPEGRARAGGVLTEAGLEVVASAADVRALGDGLRLDAVVLSADRIGPGELEAIAFVQGEPLEARAVAVAAALGGGAVRRALESGVGAIVRAAQLEECVALAVRSACAGQISLPRRWRDQLDPPPLTNRQKQALAMVVLGMANRDIARKLGVTEGTVKSHLTTAFRKLGVRSRNEAAALILREDGGLGTGILAISPTNGNVTAIAVDPPGPADSRARTSRRDPASRWNGAATKR